MSPLQDGESTQLEYLDKITILDMKTYKNLDTNVKLPADKAAVCAAYQPETARVWVLATPKSKKGPTELMYIDGE